MIFERETYDSIVDDIVPLLTDHHTEVEWGQDKIPLNPDLGKYEDMIMSGDCAIFSMREEGELIGYASFFIYEHPHHKGTYFASNDMLYVKPDNRGRSVPEFISYCEEELAKDGCNVISISFKAGHNHMVLMSKSDYEMTEIVYSKHIG
jgi:hypothetical protein